VIAFTSDANARWSAAWAAEEVFAKFWEQILESAKNRTAEKSGEIDFDVRPVVRRETIGIELAIYDEALENRAPPPTVMEITEPGGEKRKINFTMIRRGLFNANIDKARAGDYRLDISYGATQLAPLAITVPGESFGEQSGKGVDFETLQLLAEATSGKLNPSASEIKTRQRESKRSWPLFTPLAILAAMLVIIEALIRELGLSVIPPRLAKLLGVKLTDKSAVQNTGIYAQRRKRA